MSFSQIVKGITPEHVKMAIEEIDEDGIPKKRRSTKWCLKVGNRRYPPKYVLALASEQAKRQVLLPEEYSGGEQTNQVLKNLGFTIIEHPDGSNVQEN